MTKICRKIREKSACFWGKLSPLGLSFAIAAFVFDQLHKWWMINVFEIEQRQPVKITEFFELVMVWNRGISYGLFPILPPLFLFFSSLAASVVLWIWLAKVEKPIMAVAIGLIIGGALANGADRLSPPKAVADFFHFHIGGFSWYVFNLADIAIVIGVGLLIYEAMFPLTFSHKASSDL